MPLVTDYRAVKEIYQRAAARGVSLPSFCVEDRETLEAILAGAFRPEEVSLPASLRLPCLMLNRPAT
jgi:fructose/tagatose bisphosphate aldolase